MHLLKAAYILPAILFAGAVPLSSKLENPRVTIANGTVIGKTKNSVDTFKGIPFADPPKGPLRLRPPQALSTGFGTLQATSEPVACLQHPSVVDPNIVYQLDAEAAARVFVLTYGPGVVGEDCLTLNVQRPSSAGPDSRLPVLAWIPGGGFEHGSTNETDFASVVAASVSLGHPVIVVQMNYRLGVFGFLAGRELQREGSTNLGLRDQRLALQWIAENIHAFGGDPGRVTLWGESAGSFSVFDQLLVNGGDNTYHGKPLFRAAIMNSGSSVTALPADNAAAQGVYDALVGATGCAAANNSLECLRALQADVLNQASSVIPGVWGTNGVALNFSPRPDPHDAFFSFSNPDALKTKMAYVPILAGNQDDEGTFFALALLNATTSSRLVDALQLVLPETSRSTIQRLVEGYSTDPALGSPFGTGSANQLYPGFKRNAAISGDSFFTFQTRALFAAVAERVPVRGYLATYSKVSTLGTFHGSDVLMRVTGKPRVPLENVLQYFISFANFMDPNVISRENGKGSVPEWPRWTSDGRKIVNFTEQGPVVVKDDFREEQYKYFETVRSQLRL